MSKISIKRDSFRNDDSLKENFVNLEISGKDINYVVLNTLRRIILEFIPANAWDEINIVKNTSVYNNDYMRNRIETLPIFNHDVKLDFNYFDIIEKYTRNIESKEVFKPEYYKEVNMYIKYKNNTKDIISITTDDCDFFFDGKKINSIYKNPVLVVKLKPNEEFEMSAKTNINIGLNHIKYSLVSKCSYEEINENKFLFKLFSRGQIDEIEIIKRAIEIILYKLNKLKDNFSKQKFSSDSHGKIILNEEDHTLGNLLSRYLQENDSIELASYRLDHLLIRNITIEYILNNKKNINEILENIINNIIKIYSSFKNDINNIKLN